MEYNPYLFPVQHDPYPVYRWLRDEAPVYHNPDLGFWALSRFDDVRDAHVEASTYLSSHGVSLEGFDEGRDLLFNKDAPEHTWNRRIMSRVFTPRAVSALEDSVRANARRLLDELHGTDTFDAAQQFASKLPMDVVSELLGLPEDIRPTVEACSHRIFQAQEMTSDPTPTEDAMAAGVELMETLGGVVAARMAEPGDDVISMLLGASVEDDTGAERRLTPEQVIFRAFELSSAGHETTAKMIGSGLVALAWYPEQRAELVADPGLLPGAIEEMMRWDGPINFVARFVEHEVEWHGTTIPANSRVLLVNQSANHDERVFEEPELFDIHRPIERHFGFGLGPHVCLGQALARLELRVAFGEFLARYPTYEIVEPGVRRGLSGHVRGLTHLPVKVG
jgi:cytochrome P450